MPRITPEEWRAVVESSPFLELWEGETDVYTVTGCDDLRPALGYDEDGTIWVRYGYFEEVLPRMLEIASKLGAVVQGDEGEYYLISDGERQTTYDRPNPPSPIA